MTIAFARARLVALLPLVERVLDAQARQAKLQRTAKAEQRLQRRLGTLFVAQCRAFVRRLGHLQPSFGESARLREVVRESDWEPLLLLAFGLTRAEFLAALTAGAEPMLLAGGEDALAELVAAGDVELSWTLKNPRAVAYLEDLGATRVTGIEETTRQALRDLLSQAADQGWTYQQTAKAITDQFAEFSQSRAEMIATTEIGNAYEYARRQVADSLAEQGYDLEKRWLTVDAPCDICDENMATDWIGLDEDFPSGDQQPTAHPRCRCTLQLRTASGDETTADSGQEDQ